MSEDKQNVETEALEEVTDEKAIDLTGPNPDEPPVPQPRNDELNSMCYWHPITEKLNVPQPETIILEIPDDFRESVFDCHGGDGEVSDWHELERCVHDLEYPLFIRTDLSSGKHEFENTCYVKDRESLLPNVCHLLIENAGADILGLPFKALAIREYIQPASMFRAFSGNLPIGAEQRYFVEGGKVLCHHAYWPADAIRPPSHPYVLPDDWRGILEKLNNPTSDEMVLMEGYARLISKHMPGRWSVDFMKASNGIWHFIDMATADDSWHWPGCPIGK